MTSGNEKAELQRKRKMVITKGKSKERKQNQNGRVATKESCPATEKKRNAMMKRLVAQKEIVTKRRIKLQRKDRVITIEKF